MNIYYYWFFFVYNIYYRYCKDNDFEVFALGMFSCVFVGFPLLSVCYIVAEVLDYLKLVSLFSDYPIIVYAVLIGPGIINYFLFIYNGVHRQLYAEYLRVQTTSKDILCLVLSICSIAMLLLTAFFSRRVVNYLMSSWL